MCNLLHGIPGVLSTFNVTAVF
ncbi:chemokine (C-X-C motif) ligand 4, isoform CRA_c [Rattus norvegicus]|uniref:Chemokine (C-X-C motif) ligand 4, isoform CRA_c n=1 Tax=Rattus norvegicus TaxID=10116 RepID=A6KKE2_RAT|nr:chemokine (C-X-C motif) ligand 4, isoform CRA_c [Rattus norvegicus]